MISEKRRPRGNQSVNTDSRPDSALPLEDADA